MNIDKYKSSLKDDFMCYLAGILTHDLNKEQSSKFLGNVLESWSRRLDENLKGFEVNTVKMMLQKENNKDGDQEDVLNILVNTQYIAIRMIKDEFIEDLIHLLDSTIRDKK